MRSPRRANLAAVLLAAALTVAAGASSTVWAQPDDIAEPAVATTGDVASTELTAYFTTLEQLGLIDVYSGDKATLTKELAAGEALLRGGAALEAAVALYAIIESPRYVGFEDFVEYQNAEYDLALALHQAGAFDNSLTYLARILRRGPQATYWGPAHRIAVDIALDTRDHAAILARLERAAPSTGDAAGSLPASAMGERAYLRGRIAYDAGKLDEADRLLATVPVRSRLNSSALYLRGVLAARQGKYRAAATSFCDVAGTADNAQLAFVVDDRYYTVKDLARLGLGRIAHEGGEYDDAYYHYFQIPDDSDRLPEALFEAAWSMYQRRDLSTSRDLVSQFTTAFPTSPLWPEAGLLAGYVELADCKFDGSQTKYDELITRLTPIVDELNLARTDAALRSSLLGQAMDRWRARTAPSDGTKKPLEEAATATSTSAEIVALLRLDPAFVRLNESMMGMDRAAGDADEVIRSWKGLAEQLRDTKVSSVTAEASSEVETKRDAAAIAQDFVALTEQVRQAERELATAKRDGTIDATVAAEEAKRLSALKEKVIAAKRRAEAAADAAAAAIAPTTPASLRPLITADVDKARELQARTIALRAKLNRTADVLAKAAVERLYEQTRKVLDKARLGKIDAVIGQKRALDIDVQDLAAGRLPAELKGRLWSASQIGDDEEFWPFQGEYWADEYEGWR